MFRSSEVRRLLLDLDPYGGTDPLGMFPLFLKRTADAMDPRLCEVFRRLVTLAGLVSGVTFGKSNLMRVRPRL